MGDILSGWVMAAGAGGAGSIFQGAQHETGENSGVGPLPADINMVEPPSDHELSATLACGTNQIVHFKKSTLFNSSIGSMNSVCDKV